MYELRDPKPARAADPQDVIHRGGECSCGNPLFYWRYTGKMLSLGKRLMVREIPCSLYSGDPCQCATNMSIFACDLAPGSDASLPGLCTILYTFLIYYNHVVLLELAR